MQLKVNLFAEYLGKCCFQKEIYLLVEVFIKMAISGVSRERQCTLTNPSVHFAVCGTKGRRAPLHVGQ